MKDAFTFCPRCATRLEVRASAGRDRPACPAPGCGFVHWGNPTPVVAAIVEVAGAVILVRNKGWPEKMFGLVTGFLEAGESPEAGVLREVHEELGVEASLQGLVGVYPFELKNELIIAFHLTAVGPVKLGDELEAYKAIAVEKVRSWPFGTGLALSDWLERRHGERV